MKPIAAPLTKTHQGTLASLRIGGVVTGVGVLIASVACGTSKPSQAPVLPAARVNLARSGGEAGSGWLAATLTSTQRATLSTRMAGHIRKVHVQEGQRVAAGALLVSLADEDLQGGLKAAEAAISSAA